MLAVILCLIVNMHIANHQLLGEQCLSPMKGVLFLALLFNHLILIQTLCLLTLFPHAFFVLLHAIVLVLIFQHSSYLKRCLCWYYDYKKDSPHSDGGKSRSWLGSEGSPQREDPQQRLRWQAHLEFTHNHTVGDLTWELIDPVLARSDRLRALVLGGIPHSMRPQVSRLAQHEHKFWC